MRISADITNKHAENHPIRLYFSARLENALRFANAVGALTTTQRGAIPALPVKADVERFLRDLE